MSSRLLSTLEAATCSTEHGRRVSASRLQKYRLMAPEDPGDRGPPYRRDESGRCWYAEADVIAWADAWVSRLRSTPMEQPERLRVGLRGVRR